MKPSKSIAFLLFGSIILSSQWLHAAPTAAFKFNSNSTGADGVLNLTLTECPAANTKVTIDVGASGIKNYKSISVHENCIINFTPVGSGSAPVRLIVQEDVVIKGKLNLDGSPGIKGSANVQSLGGKGGPGGYDGGNGGAPVTGSAISGQTGYGPGGGVGSPKNSCWNGNDGKLTPSNINPADQPLVGGSGGGGGCRPNNDTGAGAGGGGGGALLIAASGKITIAGTLSALGGAKITAHGRNDAYHGGDGSKGMIHLIANTIDGTGAINSGYSILETLDYQGTFTSSGTLSKITFQQLTLSQGPTLAIATVEGQAVTDGVGIILNSTGSITVGVTATKLAAGTTVTLIANGESPASTSTTLTLDNNGAGSGKIDIGSGVSLITAYVSGLVTPTANLEYQDEKIVTARLEATPGQPSQMTFYTASGKSVPPQVAKELNLEGHVHFGEMNQ